MFPFSKHFSAVYSITECTFKDDKNYLRFSKNQILKNFSVFCLVWWIFFSVYDCLKNLQSTINSEEGIGVISIAVQFGGGMFVSLLFTKYLIEKLGCKMITLLSIVFHLPYIAANFYPHWITMILSSIFASIGTPMIWASMGAYLNDLSILYTEHIQNTSDLTTKHSGDMGDQYTHKYDDGRSCNNENTKIPDGSLKGSSSEARTSIKDNGFKNIAVSNQKVSVDNPSNETIDKYHSPSVRSGITARLFGIHGMVYFLSRTIGNIMTYFILKVGAEEVHVTNSTCLCGVDFCHDQIGCSEGNLKPPGNEIRFTLIGVCLAFAVVSVIITALFLDELKEKGRSVSLSMDSLMASCRVFKSWKFVLLSPLTLYNGILNGFSTGDFTQAFIGCAWGIHNIALALIVFGIILALSSSICGWLIKYLGRLPIFLFSAALNAITCALMLWWKPDEGEITMIFVVGVLLHFVIGTYSFQSQALCGLLFKKDEEAAFGAYEFWFCAGAALAFSYSKYFCTSIKIYIILCVSTIAILGYLVVEIFFCKEQTKK